MAVYKNREVQLLGRADGADVSPTYRVLDSQGQEEQVQLNQLQVTEEEKKQLNLAHGSTVADVKVISNKDLQELRDGQDPKKIEERQKKEGTDVTVPVSEVRVDKSKITPVMTKAK